MGSMTISGMPLRQLARSCLDLATATRWLEALLHSLEPPTPRWRPVAPADDSSIPRGGRTRCAGGAPPGPHGRIS